MNLAYINRILGRYSIEPAQSFEELPRTTSGNTSYVINTDNESYVLRQLVRQGVTGATEEQGIQKKLNANDVKTPIYLATKSGDIVASLADGSFFVLSRLIEGSRQSEDTLDLARDMGSTLARIHDAMPDTRVAFNRQQWFSRENAQHQLENYKGSDNEFLRFHTKAYASILDKDLPHALIHGDFHTNNIFSADNKVTAVFDFESAERTVRILDIARLYLTYVKVTNLDPGDILQVITDGYNSKTNAVLQDNEFSELNNAFIYVALVSGVSIANHGNSSSASKYFEIANNLINQQSITS